MNTAQRQRFKQAVEAEAWEAFGCLECGGAFVNVAAPGRMLLVCGRCQARFAPQRRKAREQDRRIAEALYGGAG